MREEFGTPSGLEILLSEGGDVELGARTSEHIVVFEFDPSSLNSLSFICVEHCIFHIIHIACVVLALIHIAYSLYAWIVCVCLTCT